MRAICTENSVEHTQSYTRIPVWPEIRDSKHLSRTVLRVCTQLYYMCRNYVIYVFLLILLQVNILRNTIINNSLKRSSFSVSDVTDEHNM